MCWCHCFAWLWSSALEILELRLYCRSSVGPTIVHTTEYRLWRQNIYCRNRNRKLKISRALTKAKSREPACSQALIQNKIDRQRVRSRESGRQTVRRLWWMVFGVGTGREVGCDVSVLGTSLVTKWLSLLLKGFGLARRMSLRIMLNKLMVQSFFI